MLLVIVCVFRLQNYLFARYNFKFYTGATRVPPDVTIRGAPRRCAARCQPVILVSGRVPYVCHP